MSRIEIWFLHSSWNSTKQSRCFSLFNEGWKSAWLNVRYDRRTWWVNPTSKRSHWASHQTSRNFWSSWNCLAKRSFALWSSWNWKDTFSKSSCPSYWLSIHLSFRSRACSKVYWRRSKNGQRVIRHGQRTCPFYHFHGWNWFYRRIKTRRRVRRFWSLAYNAWATQLAWWIWIMQQY